LTRHKSKKKGVKGKKKGSGPDRPVDMLHAFVPGTRPSDEQLSVMTRNFQKEIENSPLWNQMVSQFGREKAEGLLKEVKINAEQFS